VSGAVSSRRARRTRTTRRPLGSFAIDGAFLAAIAALGVVAAWPIYADVWLLVVAAAAFALAVGISVLAAARRWRWWYTALATAGVYVLAGVPLAVPSALREPAQLPAAAVQVLTAPVTGWKNLLTLDLPVGTYQATLAPAFLLFLVLPVVSLSFAWRGTRTWVIAVPVALVLPVFGILFGSSAVRGVLALGPVAVPGVVELLTGAGALLIALGWYVWRIAADRSAALRIAQDATAVRVRRPSGAAAGRWLLAGAMTLVAAVVGVAVAPVAVGGTRDVLRGGVDPELRVRTALSPLTTYREYFSDEGYDEELFNVRADGPLDRVRVATLSYYDGVVARVVDPEAAAGDQETAFLRVPARDGAGTTTTATVEIAAYTGLWVPLVGALRGMEFSGGAQSALTDGFYYSDAAEMGVELADPGLVAGVSMRQSAQVPTSPAALASLVPAESGARIDDAFVPASLVDWIAAQDVPEGGAGLEALIQRLRARGYLSHGLSYDEAAPPAWAAQLGDYSFEPSRAGHSTDRIGELFAALLQRQQDVGGTSDAALVAAPGDDEQFAVAAALIADQLGFTARVVLGARLAVPEGDADLPVCEDGTCLGQDMSAWIEVQDAAGSWIAVDTTPQHENPITPQVEQLSDPQVPTDVEPEQAQIVPPPDAAPAEGAASDDDDSDSGVDLGPLWAGLRIAGVSLLIALLVLGPFAGIVLVKLFRRRARRRSPDPIARVVGGWEEYVDAAVDSGRPLPRTQTRREIATLYEGGAAAAPTALATFADRSVFGEEPPTADDDRQFWELVEEERRRMLAELGWWRRLRARLSLRSLRRSARALVAAQPDARARDARVNAEGAGRVEQSRTGRTR
jgi:hypothetical protein